MALDVLFALRGLLAFVAFTEFTNAGRCFLPDALQPSAGAGANATRVSYVSDRLFSNVELDEAAESLVSHVYGLYSVLTGLVVLHLAIFSHYRPLVSLSLCVISTKLVFLLVHVFWLRTIARDHNLIFPLVSCVFALMAVVAVPFCTGDDNLWRSNDENAELLRKMKLPKKSKQR